MVRVWLTLALFTLSSGCFDRHGRPGGGPADGGTGALTCERLDARFIDFTCPEEPVSLGRDVHVRVESQPYGCCTSGTILLQSVEHRDPWRHVIDVDWDACGCCEECNCLAPIQTASLNIGPLFEPGTHAVEWGDGVCHLEVVEDDFVPECMPGPGGDLRAPEHLLEGQSYAATMTVDNDGIGGGCGCTLGFPDGDDLDLRTGLCGCCEGCECIDPGYQASHVAPPPPLGDHLVVIPHGTGAVSVHPRDICFPMRVTDLRLEGPRDELIVSGPRLHWARVDGLMDACCATPIPVVERTEGPAGEIVLELLSCHELDCACFPATPVEGGTWFSLGELAPGNYTVRAGDVVQTYTVP